MNHTHDTNTLIACDYEDLHSDIRTLSIDTNAGPILHILLRDKFAEDFRLMQIFEASSKFEVTRYDYTECNPLWINIPIVGLDLSIGLHDYIIEFINAITGDTVYQYFSYRVQSDNPDRNYIYINR